MGDQLGQRQADAVGSLQKVECGRVVLRGVHPGAYGGHLLVAEVVMVVDNAFPSIHEKAHFAQAAAALHELPGVGPGLAYARALKDEVRQAAAVVLFHGIQQFVQIRVPGEVIRAGGSHFPGQFQAGVIAVHSDDGFNAQRAQRGDLKKADGAAALHENHGIELEEPG